MSVAQYLRRKEETQEDDWAAKELRHTGKVGQLRQNNTASLPGANGKVRYPRFDDCIYEGIRILSSVQGKCVRIQLPLYEVKDKCQN